MLHNINVHSIGSLALIRILVNKNAFCLANVVAEVSYSTKKLDNQTEALIFIEA